MASRVTVDDQIRFAEDRGHAVTRRQLERYRYEGLMPRPERTQHNGLKGVPTYPQGSCEQLVYLVELDAEVTGEARVVALAMAGFPVDLGVLQHALASQLRGIEVGVWAFAERCAAERGGTSLDALAEKLALARPRGVDVPRRRGQLEASRIAAVRFVLEAFLLGRRLGRGEHEAELLIGLDRARKDVMAPLSSPWLIGRWGEAFAEVGSLPALRRSVGEACPSEIDEAVRLARVFNRLMPVAAMAIGAQTKRRSRGGFAWLQRLRVTPGFGQSMWIGFMVSVVRSPMRANALDVAVALAPFEEVRDGIGQLVAMPANQRDAVLARLPATDRAQMNRLLVAARQRSSAELERHTRNENARIDVQAVRDP